MKLISEPIATINVLDLRDNGEIAIIRNHVDKDYIGRIVQRYENSLISLGYPSDCGWSDLFTESNADFPVEILKSGTRLQIQ